MKAFNRKRALVLLLVALIAAQAFLCFDWLTVSMAPQGKVTVLGTLAGSALFPAAQSLLMLAWVTYALLAIARGRVMVVFASMLLAVFGLALWITGQGLLTSDWHAQKAQLSTWENIAAAHDITDLTLVVGANGWLFAVAATLGLLAALGATLSAGGWAKIRPAGKQELAGSAEASAAAASGDQTGSPVEPNDAISMWENQRAK